MYVYIYRRFLNIYHRLFDQVPKARTSMDRRDREKLDSIANFVTKDDQGGDVPMPPSLNDH